jgi:hypothetical protein
MSAPDGSRVYVIGDPNTNGPVKIGTTRSLPARLAAIKSGRGAVVPDGVDLTAIEVLYDYPGDRNLERALHQFNAASRLVGEWFNIPATDTHNLVMCYLVENANVYNIIKRGTDCGCWRCKFQHAPDDRPGDRPELVDPSHELIATIHAMTHARLGVDFADEHVGLPASHCDIDRAKRLLEVFGSIRRYSRSA